MIKSQLDARLLSISPVYWLIYVSFFFDKQITLTTNRLIRFGFSGSSPIFGRYEKYFTSIDGLDHHTRYHADVQKYLHAIRYDPHLMPIIQQIIFRTVIGKSSSFKNRTTAVINNQIATQDAVAPSVGAVSGPAIARIRANNTRGWTGFAIIVILHPFLDPILGPYLQVRG